MADTTDSDVFYPASVEEWRAWLAEHGRTAKSVRVILYHKGSGVTTITYEQAVEQALCFGWIDGKGSNRDAHSAFQTFMPRNSKGTWSQSNRERVERLTAAGLMTPAGQEMVDLAKRTGTWEAMADAENLVVPADLQAAFDQNEAAWSNYQAFTKSVKRVILEWILRAKRPETRRQRIERTVALAARNTAYFLEPR